MDKDLKGGVATATSQGSENFSSEKYRRPSPLLGTNRYAIMIFMSTRTCKNSHIFEKTSDCLVCPICSSQEMKAKYAEVLPKIASPALRALDRIGISSLRDLTKITEQELLDLHGFGPNALEILRKKLYEKGLSFKK